MAADRPISSPLAEERHARYLSVGLDPFMFILGLDISDTFPVDNIQSG